MPVVINARRVFILFLFFLSCKEDHRTVKSRFEYITPRYNGVQVIVTEDTLHFPLNEDTYNGLKSFNMFLQDSTAYISFHDRRSESVNIYNLNSKTLVKRILLKTCLPGEKLYKPTVYVKSFDSIYVVNQASINLVNGTGTIMKSIDFLDDPPLAWSFFDNSNPPIFKDNRLLSGVRPYVKESSLKALKKWKVMYEFDLEHEKASLSYNLPDMYQKDLYGYHLLDYSYCYNDSSRFVFSFAADTNIYETNLTSYHIAYYGKSIAHKAPVKPIDKKDLLNDKASEHYMLADSYGAIFFDPYRKRYLRVARHKISKADYDAKKRVKQQSLIIFDEQFRIIGESEIDESILLQSLFFSHDGNIYARVKASDEYALHFVRLVYKEEQSK